MTNTRPILRISQEEKEEEAQRQSGGVEVGETSLPFAQPSPASLFMFSTVGVPSDVSLDGLAEMHLIRMCGEWGKKSTDGSLADFLKLAGSRRTPAHVVTFVRRWGPLRIFPQQISEDKDQPACLTEAVDVYFRLARKLNGYLKLAAALRQGESTQKKDWDAASQSELPFSGFNIWNTDLRQVPLEQQKFQFRQCVSRDLLSTGYVPAMQWDTDGLPCLTIESRWFSQWDRWHALLVEALERFEYHLHQDSPQTVGQAAEELFFASPSYVEFIAENPCPSRLYNSLRLQTVAAMTAPDVQENKRDIVCFCGEIYQGQREYRDKSKNRCPKHKAEAVNDSHRNSYHTKKSAS